MVTRRGFIAALVFLLFFLSPAMVHAFWPLMWEHGKETHFLGPLASYENKEGNAHLTVRPLLFSHDTEEGGTSTFLYPLGKKTKDKSFFIPFYLSKGDEEQSDTSVFLLFWGKSKEKRYGGLFPLYGRMHDRFSKDELSFFLWPLYSYTSSEGATRRNFLWPLFSSYGGKESGFKFWPFYGSRTREGVRSRTFFLWPVFTWEDKNLDTSEPMHSFFAFPFYMETKSEQRAYYNVLFPFFSYQKDDVKNKWSFLWSFYSKTEGRENKGYSVFPFIMKEEHDRDRTLTLFWPLFRESVYYVRDEQYTERRIAVINRYIEDDRGIFFNIWPFFEYRKKGEESSLFLPSIFPFRDAGYDRLLKPVLTLYERKRTATGKQVNILYGLYTQEEEGENWKRRFAFLLEVRKESGTVGFEILSGLLGMDKERITLFFIPFKR